MAELSSLSVGERITKFVEVYQWLRNASQERILTRRNLNLQAVHPFANALTIVDISTPNFWRVRLSGTKACERSGADTTGCNALQAFSREERTLRAALAHSLFEGPSAIRARTRETYANGDHAILDTVALPLLGEGGERLVAHYAQVERDIDHDYRERPKAKRTELVSYSYVDLGYGCPDTEIYRLSA